MSSVQRLETDVAGMMPPADLPYKLEVSRADLVQALKIISRAIRSENGDTSLRFEDGCLSVEAENTVADAPASGTWPRPIFVSVSWVKRLAKRMPTGDLIHLRVDAGRLHANRYSQPCAWTSTACANDSRLPKKDSWLPKYDEEFLVVEAARILTSLHVQRPAVEGLIAEARARGTSSLSRGTVKWSEDEKKLCSIIEKAWIMLAPFGVGMTDIYQLVDETIRNAWRIKREK